MNKKIILCALFLVFISSTCLAQSLSLDSLIAKVQENQGLLRDMQADITTTISSPMQKEPMVQKGHIWSKGSDKSKIEISEPMKQTTIMNGTKMLMEMNGQKTVQDLSKMGNKGFGADQGKMSLEKAKEYFDLSVKQGTGDSGQPARIASQSEAGGLTGYIVTGIPKQKNDFLGKMEFYIDPGKFVPTRIAIYNGKGKLITTSVIEYMSAEVSTKADSEISGIWVPIKNISNVTMPTGSMSIEQVFENVKVNAGIKDSVFAIE